MLELMEKCYFVMEAENIRLQEALDSIELKFEILQKQLKDHNKLLEKSQKTITGLVFVIRQLGTDMTQLELACSCYPGEGRSHVCICGAGLHNKLLEELINRTIGA